MSRWWASPTNPCSQRKQIQQPRSSSYNRRLRATTRLDSSTKCSNHSSKRQRTLPSGPCSSNRRKWSKQLARLAKRLQWKLAQTLQLVQTRRTYPAKYSTQPLMTRLQRPISTNRRIFNSMLKSQISRYRTKSIQASSTIRHIRSQSSKIRHSLIVRSWAASMAHLPKKLLVRRQLFKML